MPMDRLPDDVRVEERNHATVFLVDSDTWKTNVPGMSSKDFTLQTLQAAGR
jgi:hypothetical protein